jgi:hypothetical protein
VGTHRDFIHSLFVGLIRMLNREVSVHEGQALSA